ncbi:MAG TPA: hypothetical protein VFO11_07885 [Candidatus Polarisedimenticolaceae bacterium]|nr:hypothetical protein [Candidatus Polarisedimenticolaceae bacterium]
MNRRVAAAVALLYVAIQTFQWYVFSKLPETEDPVISLMQGPLPLNIARAATMLLSFFGLAYLFLVVCGIAFRRRPGLAIAAFLGFFIFCLLEIQLRSVELFWVYLDLPRRYQAATTAPEQARVLEAQATFQAVQHALYFPLGLSWLIGSVLVFLALGDARLDWLARWAFGLNAGRLALRMLDSYVLGPRFDTLYGNLYLPLVFLTFVPLAIWLKLSAARDTDPTRRPAPVDDPEPIAKH